MTDISRMCDCGIAGSCSFCMREWRAPKPSPAYKPKVGERARLVSSPDTDDHVLCGETLNIERIDKSCRSYYWRVRMCDGPSGYVHCDAVWAPVKEQPEPPASGPVITTSAQFRDRYPELWLEVYAQGCADGMNKAIANLERLVRHG